jgi:hypothetical protein
VAATLPADRQLVRALEPSTLFDSTHEPRLVVIHFSTTLYFNDFRMVQLMVAFRNSMCNDWLHIA